jgi:hypothetical protein
MDLNSKKYKIYIITINKVLVAEVFVGPMPKAAISPRVMVINLKKY